MNFSNKLDRAIQRAIGEENVLGTQNQIAAGDQAKAHKLLADFSHAADRASIGLSELKRIMEESGLAQNKALMPFMEQLEVLSENLKEDGVLRKNFESVLALPMIPKK